MKQTYIFNFDPQKYTDVKFDPKSGGVKATHRGHTQHTSAKERTYFDGLTGNDLERQCQDQLFRTGHTAILRDESQKDSNGNYLPSLDLELDGRLIDIRSITVGTYYGNALMAKNKQLGNINKKTKIKADSLLLYFHDSTLFSEERLLKDIKWYQNHVIEVGSKQRIKHLYVVVDGVSKLRTYDL